MAERKRPRRTRERILETALLLFNREGEPHVTTAHVADEMNISPGNLYYHFRNKDEIIGELYGAYEARVMPILAKPRRAVDVEDLWLLLHLLFEAMWAYRFLYRDLDELTSRNDRLAARFARLLQHTTETMVEFCGGLVTGGSMRANAAEIAAISRNAVLVATYSLSFHRLTRGSVRGKAVEIDLGLAAYHVLALIAPYLIDDARLLLQRLGDEYL
jgi:AcrR family transcriptional regulator